MKINSFLIVISFLLTAMISFSVFSYSQESTMILSTVVSSITYLSYLGGLLAVKFEDQRGNVLKTTTSIVFLIINIFLTFIFLKFNYSIPLFILINGSVLLIYYSILYFFVKAKY